MKKFLLGVWLFLSTSLVLAQMPEKTRQEVAQAIQQGNCEQAVRLLRPWAERGDAEAQAFLNWVYSYGQGIAQNYAQMRERWEKGAAQGDAGAQYNLGWMYHYGRGVAQDYAKARKWYEQAATQGLAKAQYNLGWMYKSGRGGVQDYAKAREWLEKAAAQTENVEDVENAAAVRKARRMLEKIHWER